jgi:OOP family OmpA-OmpF porin
MAKTWTIIVLAGAVGLAAAAPTWADNPSADQIIESLRPVTRGIRPMNPPADAPPTVTSVPSLAPAPVPAPEAAAPAWTAPPPAIDHPAPRIVSAPVPVPAPTPPPAPQAAPSVNLTVQFATGSAELTPAAVQTLDELGRALSSPVLAGFRFRIEGHTDTVGTREYNRVLSENRAARVLDYLAARWNVRREMVTTIGMGQDQPLVPTGPNVAEPRNRRVTVINLSA